MRNGFPHIGNNVLPVLIYFEKSAYKLLFNHGEILIQICHREVALSFLSSNLGSMEANAAERWLSSLKLDMHAEEAGTEFGVVFGVICIIFEFFVDACDLGCVLDAALLNLENMNTQNNPETNRSL